MDRRESKFWYIGTTHVLTSYVTAGILAFVIVLIAACFMVGFNLNNDTTSVYVSLLTSLVVLPLAVFPATMYSARFCDDRYLIKNKDAVIRAALIAVAVFKIIIDWLTFDFFKIAEVISFLLALTVFYGVSMKYLKNNEYNDMIQIKDLDVKTD